jgi:hypothetical protein
MSAIEKELLEVTGFKPKKNISREDYLTGIFRLANKLSDDEFDELSADVQDWMNAAGEAVNSRESVPEFPDVETEESDDPEDEEASSDEDEDAEIEGETSDDDDTESSDDGDAEDADEDEEPAPKAKALKKAKPEVDEDEDEEISSDAGDEVEDDVDEPSDTRKNNGKPKRGPNKSPLKSPKTPRAVTSEMDKFGIQKNSKASQAVAMFEKGASMKQIKEKLGGPQNNILLRLQREGHLVERYDGLIKVTHKDEIPKGKRK